MDRDILHRSIVVKSRLCTSVAVGQTLTQIGVRAYQLLASDGGSVVRPWVANSHSHGPRRVQTRGHCIEDA